MTKAVLILGAILGGAYLWTRSAAASPASRAMAWVDLPAPASRVGRSARMPQGAPETPFWTMRAWVALQVDQAIAATDSTGRPDFAILEQTAAALNQHPDGQVGAVYLAEYARAYQQAWGAP